MTKHIFISAGEISGDLHAAGLVGELNKILPEIALWGLGGDLLREQGTDLLYHVDQLSTMGFAEVIRKLPYFRQVVRQVKRRLSNERPDFAILVDFPGMNFKFAEHLNKLGIPFVYYILPQVWAWHQSRIEKMKRWNAKFISILPFEPEFFERYGLTVEYFGHPLIDLAKPDISREEFRESIGLLEEEDLVAVLPGSRRQEITRILPHMLAGLRHSILQGQKMRVVCRPANPQQNDLVGRFIARSGIEVDLFNGNLHSLLRASDLALVASGTATVDTAICGTAAIVLYRTNLLTYMIAKSVVKVQNIALANLIAGDTIYPELIQNNVGPGQISHEIRKILSNPAMSESIRSRIDTVSVLLGEGEAYVKAAERVKDLILK